MKAAAGQEQAPSFADSCSLIYSSPLPGICLPRLVRSTSCVCAATRQERTPSSVRKCTTPLTTVQ
eukprot:6869131-Prymnesium_polylepis.1